MVSADGCESRFVLASTLLPHAVSVLKGRVCDVVHFCKSVKKILLCWKWSGNACVGLTKEKVLLPGVSLYLLAACLLTVLFISAKLFVCVCVHMCSFADPFLSEDQQFYHNLYFNSRL